MEDIYKNIEERNSNKKSKTLAAIDDMIADLLSTKKVNPTVAKLFFYCFPHTILFCSTKKKSSVHYLLMKIPNKQELQQIAFKHSADTDYLNLYNKCTVKPYSFLVIDTTLALNVLLRFRKNLLERI